MSRVLLAGVSTRAAAESAARAGFSVTAIDAFADLDQHAAVRAISIPRDAGRPYSARAAVRASRAVGCDAVAYLSNFENHPAMVRALASGRTLWGNTPEVLRRARDPDAVVQALSERGVPVPDVLTGAPQGDAGTDERDASGRTWMLKPRLSGGGHGVRRWRPGSRIPAGSYLQEFVDGVPASIVFVAARGRAVPLAMSHQLIGEAAFGVSGYRYCGNLLAPSEEQASWQQTGLARSAAALVDAVAEAFGLVGVNGIDIVVRNGRAWPIEINPRWTASMELVDAACGVPVFGMHVEACTRGLPRVPAWPASFAQQAHGKAIVFARHHVIAGDTRAWLADPLIRDVPRPGEHIARGGPVCTILAREPTSTSCRARLVERAAAIHETLAAWARRAA